MVLKLKASNGGPSPPPFSWDNLPSPTSSPAVDSAPSPPTSWLSAKDMKMFGAEPLRPEYGIVKCKECEKPILKSAVSDHAENCKTIRLGAKKGGKVDPGKKRKADEEEGAEEEGGNKKKKPAPKVTKGRVKGPPNFDTQCGVINDKGVPCSRSLTCKSHAMGAKRAVQGRSKPYDELLLEWNRAHNPNFVEPVKRETKAEKKEKKEREKAEKKRLAGEQAAVAAATKTATGGSAKKNKKAPPVVTPAEDQEEDMDDIDSEAEVDAMAKAIRSAQMKAVIGVPLAVPYDAGSWFVARRERLRNCRDLLATALNSRGPVAGAAPIRMS